jgi:2-polyprenyl-6-methoxyphenol hydroxylase-like FAD-dependent oxidoreductase
MGGELLVMRKLLSNYETMEIYTMNNNQTTNHRPTVLIIGGGVAGLALALFLKKAAIAPTLYEAGTEADSHAGAFLNVASNGMSVLATLGLADAVAAEGIACPAIIMWNGEGKKLGEVANGLPPGTGQPSVTIKRSRLHALLRQEAERQGIAMHFGKKLTGVTVEKGSGAHSQRVQATFADGSSAQGDLLIGCDGVHSATRRLIDPSAPAPQYTGLISCGGYARLSPSADSLLNGVARSTQHLIFGKRAFFGYLVKPDGEIYWFENLGYEGTPRRSELEAIADEEWKARLLALHSDDQPLINAIIRASFIHEGHQLGMYPIYDIPMQPVWHKGPIALIGDAAHATSPSAGQGASLALEDAIVLAKCLRDLPGYSPAQVEGAFNAFEQLRRARAEKVVKSSRRLGENKVAPNAFAAWMRDLMMPFFLRHFTNDESLRWLVGYQVAWE